MVAKLRWRPRSTAATPTRRHSCRSRFGVLQGLFRSFRDPLAPGAAVRPARSQARRPAGRPLADRRGAARAGRAAGGRRAAAASRSGRSTSTSPSAPPRCSRPAASRWTCCPSTVPPRYRANAFIALHADGDPSRRGPRLQGRAAWLQLDSRRRRPAGRHAQPGLRRRDRAPARRRAHQLAHALLLRLQLAPLLPRGGARRAAGDRRDGVSDQRRSIGSA